MEVLLILLAIGGIIGRGIYISNRAEENGLDGGTWFAKSMISRHTGYHLDSAIEAKRAVDTANSAKYDLEKKIREQNRVIDELKEPVVKERNSAFFNKVYNLSSDVRCSDIDFSEAGSVISAKMYMRSYTRGVKNVKVDLIIRDIMDDEVLVSGVIFDYDSSKYKMMWSKETKLLTNVSIVIKNIKSVDVKVRKVIFDNLEMIEVDRSFDMEVRDVERINGLRGLFGKDIVGEFCDLGNVWTCCCGVSNGRGEAVCKLCGREKKDYVGADSYDGLIEELRLCETLEEVEVIVRKNLEVYESEKLKELLELIEKDKYVKKLYGMRGEREKVQEYIEFIGE